MKREYILGLFSLGFRALRGVSNVVACLLLKLTEE